MFHAYVWNAIDLLANQNSLSCSGLARKSGLDPTVFNKSKRHTNNGKPHYPSLYSVAKILSATNTTPVQFAVLIQEQMNKDKTNSDTDI